MRQRRHRGRRGRPALRRCDAQGADGMTETIYTLYPVFAASRELRVRFADEKDRARAVTELEELFKRRGDDVRVRGTYSTVGFRCDATLMRWLSAGFAEELQRAVVEFGRTE